MFYIAKIVFWRIFSNMRMREYREAKQVLKSIEKEKSNFCTIHYSCEGFLDSGLIPRITSIAIVDFDTWQSQSFSLHISAQFLGISLEEINKNLNKIEEDMLKRYFNFLKKNDKTKFIHWNMRSDTYGFGAIELRGYVLCPNDVYILPNERKVDLPRLFTQLYGKKYIGHPQLTILIEKNFNLPEAFMSGPDEVKAFTKNEFVKLHLSTSSKAKSLPKLLRKAIDGNLKTDAKLISKYGISPDGIITMVRETWYLSLIFWLLSVIVAAFIGSILT